MKKVNETYTIEEQLDVITQLVPDVDRESTSIVYQRERVFSEGIAIKLLSIFGGLASSLLFVAFLGILGVYDSEVGLMIIGAILAVTGLVINRVTDNILLDTLSITICAEGIIMTCMSMDQMNVSGNQIAFYLMGIGVLVLIINKGYILSLASTILIFANMIFLIFANDLQEYLHEFIAGTALIFWLLVFLEARLLSYPLLVRKYAPVRIGVLLIFLYSLAMTNRFFAPEEVYHHPWITSVLLIVLLLLVIRVLLKKMNVHSLTDQILAYVITLVLVAPTILSPAIAGGILVLLLSFLTGHMTGLVISIVATVYFIAQFYYDLQFTLLTKSIVMMCSGVLLLTMYFFLTKRFSNHEEVL